MAANFRMRNGVRVDAKGRPRRADGGFADPRDQKAYWDRVYPEFRDGPTTTPWSTSKVWNNAPGLWSKVAGYAPPYAGGPKPAAPAPARQPQPAPQPASPQPQPYDPYEGGQQQPWQQPWSAPQGQPSWGGQPASGPGVYYDYQRRQQQAPMHILLSADQKPQAPYGILAKDAPPGTRDTPGPNGWGGQPSWNGQPQWGGGQSPLSGGYQASPWGDAPSGQGGAWGDALPPGGRGNSWGNPTGGQPQWGGSAPWGGGGGGDPHGQGGQPYYSGPYYNSYSPIAKSLLGPSAPPGQGSKL